MGLMFFNKDGFGIKLSSNVDMPLNYTNRNIYYKSFVWTQFKW